MENIKISIIMPVYKVEKYVAKAIRSIQAQTLHEFEFLIVDDGSPDKSGAICDQYARRDPRIKVIHKENGGAPGARNIAIDMATGKYIYFLDADDWTEPMMLKKMYNLAEREKAQLVIAGFYIDTYYKPNKFITTNYIPQNNVYKSKEEFRKDAYKLFDKNMLYSPWNKLYLASYIKENKFYFPDTLWDDFPFNLRIIRDIERVVVTSEQYYHFLRARSESETAKYIPQMYEKREEEHDWILELYRYWRVQDTASKEMIARRYIDRLIGCVENMMNPKCALTKIQKEEQIKEMLNSKRTQKCIRVARPKSIYTRIMYLPVKMKKTDGVIAEAKVISFVKKRLLRLFVILKTNR